MKTREWLRTDPDRFHERPTVVITHHAPSLRLLTDNRMLAAAYANDRHDLMGADRVAFVGAWTFAYRR